MPQLGALYPFFDMRLPKECLGFSVFFDHRGLQRHMFGFNWFPSLFVAGADGLDQGQAEDR
jgi:hypothetical protein